MSAMLGLWFGLGLTAAAEVPGTAVVASRCSRDPAASCWQQARRLTRFATAPGLLYGPAEVDVRLAWSDDGLLVRIDALPPGARVEVGLARKPGDARLSRADPGVFSGEGVHQLTPLVPVTAGDVRRIWLTLVSPDGAGAVVRPWSPAGPADPDHPPRILFAAEPATDLPLELERSTEGWELVAVAGDEVRLSHLRPSLPAVRAEMPDPWTVAGQGELSTDVPAVWGWVEAAGVWRNADGVAVDIQATRLWSEPAGPPGVSAEALFFPPVKELAIRGGSWRLPPAPAVCGDASLTGLGELVARELSRVSGRSASWSAVADCALRLEQSDEVAGLEGHEEGFALSVDGDGALVRSPTRLGLAYGALALVDAVGADARVRRLEVTDWPTIDARPLYYSVNVPGRPDFKVADMVTFVERTVLRGRYDQLHVLLSNALASPSAPELPHPTHLSADDLAPLLQLAQDVGLEVVPAVNAPAHTGWVLRNHPELTEDVNTSLLDVRHPQTHPLLATHYADVLAAYGQPTALHIGHDEAMWQSQRWFGDERNPRTSSTPRSILLADDLRWHLDWCRERGLQAYVWTDMLLSGWNGGRDGAWRALELLTDTERKELIAMAWSPLGDPFDNLQRAHGIPVMRVHTAYLDWKREGLVERLESDQPPAGEGLALFLPAPWAAFAPSTGSRNLHYHLGSVVLAGATAWEPTLETQARIRPTLAALAQHPVLRPGMATIPHRAVVALKADGERHDDGTIAWPTTLKSDGWSIPADPRLATHDHPVRWTADRSVAGATLFAAATISHSAEALLRRTVNRNASAERQAIGWMVLRYADGTEQRRPLEYGEDLYALDADPRANSMWRAADVLPLASALVASDQPDGRDLRLYRLDLASTSRSPLVELSVEGVIPGVHVTLGGAAVFLP